MNVDDTDKTFDVLRELPVELSVEQVSGLVATFSLVSSAGSWLSNINLNSLLMTSAGTIIIAGSIYLLSPTDQEPRAERASVPVPVVELAATPLVEEQQESAPSPRAPVVAVTPLVEKKDGTTPRVEQQPIAVAAPVPPIQPIPPVRTITVIPAAPGMASLQECLLAIEPGGPVMADRTFDLSGFTAVSVLGALDVVLEQGVFSVKAEGDEQQIERLDISMKDKTLIIGTKTKDGRNQYDSPKQVVVKVSLPALERIALTGSGDVMMGVFAAAEKMFLDLQGSGDIHFDGLKGMSMLSIDLDGSGDIIGEKVEVAGTTKISVAGSGDVRLAGHTDIIRVTVIGSGDVDASKVEARDCEAEVTGSGDVNMNCRTGIRSRITGSGAINNTGNADDGGGKGQGKDSN